jgi:hypothetical protein
MAFSLIGKVSVAGANTTGTLDTTGANLTVIISANWGDTSAPSDNKGNTYTAGFVSSNGLFRMYYCINPTVGTGHTFTKGGNAPAIAAFAYSGNTPTFDQAATGVTGNGTSAAVGSFTPANNGSLIISGVMAEGIDKTFSVDSGLTKQEDVYAGGAYNLAAGDLMPQTTAASINPTWSWSDTDNYSAGALVFYEDAGVTVKPWYYYAQL